MISSTFVPSEMEKLIQIANTLGITLPSDKSPSIDLYLDGIISQLKHVPYNPFPTAFHTVDILLCKIQLGKIEILLGRKPNKTTFQVIGGFVDPKQSAEESAVREVEEETNLKIHKNDLNYIGSFFIDDTRYKNSCHKVTTSLFSVFVSPEVEATAQDDIAEVRWFDVAELMINYKDIIDPAHHVLIETIKPNELNTKV